MSLRRAARSEEVAAPGFTLAEVDDTEVLLTRLRDGSPVAFGTICPHKDNRLDDGKLWEGEVDCPHHHYTYDPVTGENRYPKRVFPASRARRLEGIPTYETHEEDGWVWVGERRDSWQAGDGGAEAP